MAGGGDGRREVSEKIGLDGRFTQRRQYNVQALWEKHHEITRQVVLGRTNGAIAEDIGCTPQTISNVRNSPLAKQEIDRLSGMRDEETMAIARRIEEFAPIALDLIENIVRGRVPGASIALRAKLAGGQLNRAGYGEVHKVHSVHATLSRQDIEDIKQRALEARDAAQEVEYRDLS